MTKPTASPDVTDERLREIIADDYCDNLTLPMWRGAQLSKAEVVRVAASLLALRQEVERLTRERDRWRAAANDGQIFEQPDGSFCYEQFAAFIEQRSRAETAEASLRLVTQRREDVVEALRSLVAKLDECQPHIGSAFAMQQMRSGVQYSGPTYADELEAARTALQPKEN